MDAYDLLVIGLGPTGAVGAMRAAAAGLAVAGVERRVRIGEPVRCGELMRSDAFTEVIGDSEQFIRRSVDAFSVETSDASRVRFLGSDLGVLIDRARLERHLVESARDDGADIFHPAEATSLLFGSDGRVTGAYLRQGAREFPVRAAYTLIADGVGSRLGHQAGFATTRHPRRLAGCALARIEHPALTGGECRLVFGREIAPGGYAWVFGVEKHVAHLGLGLVRDDVGSPCAEDRLLEFVRRSYPGARLFGLQTGVVPVGTPVKRMVRPGVLLAGDAARQVHPTTGAGLSSGMFAGVCAARAVRDALADGGSGNLLAGYEARWRSRFGQSFAIGASLRDRLYAMDDDEWTAALRRLGPECRTSSVAGALSAVGGQYGARA